MIFSHDIDLCLRETIGDDGLTRAQFEAQVVAAGPAEDRLRTWPADGGLPLLALPERRDDLASLRDVAAAYRARYSDVVVLGTGASSLGARSLYALGDPADKMFTIVMVPTAGTGPVIDPGLCDDPGLEVYAGRHMGDLPDACQRATAETLVARGRPVRVLRLSAVDERTVGALMMHFIVATIVAAHLFGVDPFDQPAVEEGKVLARGYMAEAGGGADR